MKKYFSLIICLFVIFPTQVRAIDVASSIVISKAILGTTDNASDEEIVIYNNTDHETDISNLALEYKSAIGKTWSARAHIAPGTKLGAYSEYSAASLRTADTKLSSGLAQTGGNIRIMDSSGTELDKLAWGAGDSPFGEAVPAPDPNEQIERKADSTEQLLQNTRNNKADFALISQSSITPPGDPSTPPPTLDVQLLDLQINELLPDPVSPQTDANDEFIEIYNPNKTSVNLNNWQLRDAGGKTYTSTGLDIGPQNYGVVYSKQTHLSLNNDGDVITLVNPAGEIVDTSSNYDKSVPGMSWGLTDDGWAWMNPTPAQPNGPAIADAIVAAAKAKSSSSKNPPKSAASKIKAAAAKASKAKAAAAGLPAGNEDATATKPLYSVWSWLLIAAGVGTIGYGIYEYRPEIKTAYYKLRTKFSRRG